MTTNATARRPLTALAAGVTVTASVAGVLLAGAGTASAAPNASQTYTKTFVSRYHPTPQAAVIGAQLALYSFNAVRRNGNQACVERPNPVVVPDSPVGWKAMLSASCLPDAGTGDSGRPVR